MVTRILITTSRRPTPNVRRFIKQLIAVIPDAYYQLRGKLTLSMLTIWAIDFDIEKILIVRNRKGNPGYIDVYQVNHVDKTLTKFCTMYVCGFSMDRANTKLISRYKPKYIIMLNNTLNTIDDEAIAECLLAGFNVAVYDTIPTVKDEDSSYVILDVRKLVKKIGDSELPTYEVMFRDLKNEVIGPVIRICRAKIYTKVI